MTLLASLNAWWFAPLPRGRVAAFRIIVYAFVILDLIVIRPWVSDHGAISQELYQPLFVGRVLPLPDPTPLVVTFVKLALIICAVVAMTGRLPRVSGAAVFVLYLEWMFIAFSYGKVDHDRVAFLVALVVLPTVGTCRLGDKSSDSAAGWALRTIQVAVVLTYFLAVIAKLRFGGLEWLNGATLARSIITKGTIVASPLLDHPWALRAGQYMIVAFELFSPLLLGPPKIRRVMLVLALAFHVVTFATISIFFLPHVLCLLTFVPLERIAVPPGLSGALGRIAPAIGARSS
jgi:hypothetical protein